MKCPCHNCLVYIRCQQKIDKKFKLGKKEVYYNFDQLLRECDELRKYFELDTLQHRVRIKNYNSMSYSYKKTIMSYIEEQPYGKKLLEEFLKVMHIKQMPNSLNPKIRLRSPRKRNI